MRFALALLLLIDIAVRAHTESFSIPSNCNQDCTFRVSWIVTNGEVEFSVLARVKRGIWAGIGFSRDQLMIGSDAVIAWTTTTGSVVVTDRFLFAKSPSAVPIDGTNNIEVKSATQSEDVLTFTFTRDLITRDSEDLRLDEPFFLLYAWGGAGGDDGTSISMHTTRGVVPNMINLGDEPGVLTTSPQPMPVSLPMISTDTVDTSKTTTGMAISTTASTTLRTSTVSTVPSTTQQGEVNQNTSTTASTQTVNTQISSTELTMVEGELDIVDEDELDEETIRKRLRELQAEVVEGPISDRTIPDLRTLQTKSSSPSSTRIPTVTQTEEPASPVTQTSKVIETRPAFPTQTSKFVLVRTCVNKKCPQNTHCVVEHNIARCYCDAGFELDANKKCIESKFKETPKKCPQRCPDYSYCKQGVCVCHSGYVKVMDRCIASTSGRDKCAGVQCRKNSECKRGYCVCKTGFKYQNGNCVGHKPSAEDKCTGVKCPENAECKRGYCFCKSKYFNIKGRCQRMSGGKNPCDHVTCSENAVCQMGRCLCKQGYSQQTNGKCQVIQMDKCFNVKCPDNAMCKDGRCDCNPGYARQHNGACKKPNEDKCANIKCIENAECARGYCFCKSGYTYANRKCQASTPPPSDKCQRVNCPENSGCKNGFCFCKFGYVHKAGKCINTNEPKVCANMHCPEHSECRLNKCYCKTGYTSSVGKCTKIGHNICTRTNCGPHGSCVLRNGKYGCVFSNTRPQYGYQSQYGSTRSSCQGKCGSYDYARRCSCSYSCRHSGNCCSDIASHCGGVHGYYPHHG